MNGPNRCIWLALVLSAMCCCGQASPPDPTVPPTDATVLSPAHQTGVVILVLEGARPDWTSQHIERGLAPNLAAMSDRGVSATSFRPVDPNLKGPFYVSLSTGAFPQTTGVVANTYHLPGQPLDRTTDYSLTLPESTEPIWRTAMRNGLVTATVLWPAADMNMPELRASYMIDVAQSEIKPNLHHIALEAVHEPPPDRTSYSIPQQAVLTIQDANGGHAAEFRILALDSLDDGVQQYDSLVLNSDAFAEQPTFLRLDKCAAVTVSPRLQSGAYLCFTASEGVSLTLYQSQVSYASAYPPEIAAGVRDLGIPPPSPDTDALRLGWITPEQFVEIAKVRAEWAMRAGLHIYRKYHPDLLLLTQSIIADCAAASPMIQIEKAAPIGEETAELSEHLALAYTVVDTHLEDLLSLVDLANSAVLVVSGETVTQVDTTIRVNAVLKSAKLLQVQGPDDQESVVLSRTRALAVGDGGASHIYVNLQGRQQAGTVSPEDYEQVLAQITEAFGAVKDDLGEGTFSRILAADQLSDLHLLSPNGGDIFVQAQPGYYLDDGLEYTRLTGPPTAITAGGYDASIPELQGIFIAIGDQLALRRTLPVVRAVDIAPTIAKIQRFSPALTCEGKAIEGIWR